MAPHPGTGWFEDFERQLGAPEHPGSALSWARGAALDEEERFPQDALDALYGVGLAELYVPASYGGRLSSYEELLWAGRALSRRDLTVTVTCSALIWSTLMWLGGTSQQKERHVAFLRARKAPCLAYSEETHGADLLASDTVAVHGSGGGYTLSGEKWPINRATRGEAAFVLAQTAPGAGPRSLSLFLAEKESLPPGSFEHLPRVQTLGVRGCDISGIRFQACPLPESARVGLEGRGLELALKGFQVTRALCACLSLGAVDTALRTTLRLARGRTLYGDTVSRIPSVQRTFGEAFVLTCIAECVSVSAMRALHVAPEQYATWSAVVKYFVPTLAEEVFRKLSVVQGARFYMRQKHEWGVFQRMYRDNLLIGIFDGSTVVNLEGLSVQLKQVQRTLAQGAGAGVEPAFAERVARVFDVRQPLPGFEGDKLTLATRGHDLALAGLPLARERLSSLQGRVDAELVAGLLHGVTLLESALARWSDAVSAATASLAGGHRPSTELFALAERYCHLQAACSTVLLWVYSREDADRFFDRGQWLAPALDRLLASPSSDTPANAPGALPTMAQELERLLEEERLFSLWAPRVASL